MTVLYLVLGVLVLSFVPVAVLTIRALLRHRRPRVVTCPETRHHAEVRLDAGHAAFTTATGQPELRVHSCTQWPERAGCGQECVSQVETAAPNGQSPVVERRFAPDPPKAVGVDPAALDVVREGLYSAAHSTFGTSSGVFSSFPIPIAGKTGTAEKVVQLPGYPAGHTEDQSWWCGYGPSQTTMRVFEKFFGVKAQSQTLVSTD